MGDRKNPAPLSGHDDLHAAHADLARRYNDLLERSLAAVFRTSLNGTFLECNDAMVAMLGYSSREELMGVPAQELYFSKEDRARFVEKLKREKRLVNYVIALKHKDGHRVDVLENVFMDEGWHGITIQGVAIDITPQLQAQAEQQAQLNSYRSLVEHMQDGLLLVQEGIVHYANAAVISLLGEQNMIGRKMHELLKEFPQELLTGFLPQGTIGPVHIVDVAGRDLVAFVSEGVHEGRPALQVTLRDEQEQQRLYRERMRTQMAEEVNHVLRDEIAEHRRTQETLHRAKRFSRILVDSSLDMIIASDPNGIVIEYNPAASLRFGWEREQVIGGPIARLYATAEEYQRVQVELERSGVFAGEIMNVDRDGKVFTTFLSASRLYDDQGSSLGSMGVSRDITRIKRDQEALKASEERYRDLFENASDLIQSVDAEGRLQYVNQTWLDTLGYAQEQISEMTIWDVIHPDQLERCRGLFERLFSSAGSTVIRTVFKASNGQDVFVEGNTSVRWVNGMPIATRSIFRDVTKEREAEQQLKEHEAKWRALFESSDHMFWTVDRQIKLTSFNKGYTDMVERLHGVAPQVDLDPDRPRKLFADPAYHAFWETQYAEALAGRAVRFETDRIDQAGRRVCNEIFLSPVFTPEGGVKEVFGVGHEITEQKQAENLVRENAARLQAIFESSANMMIWTLDKEFRITSCNEHFVKNTEADFGVLFKVGDPFIMEAAHEAAGKNAKRYTDKYLAVFKGRPQQFEAELTDQQGNTIWVENFLNPIIVDGEVQEISCLAHNVTERKLAQMELLRSLQEKEVLLKEVHHRVKNNLQIVSSIFNLQTAFVGDDARVQSLLRDSRDRIRSMSFIHESLYQNKDFSSIDLADYIDGLARNLMMSYNLSGKVRLETRLTPVELVLDQAIPCGLVLNELISNALKHAFPNEREGIIEIAAGLDQEGVSIRVSDNGVGVSADFDPKRDRNLGLELVHTLVDQLDGTLQFSSGPGLSYLLTFERTK